MRERYFTVSNIETKARHMQAQFRKLDKPRRFNPQQAALLVLDMQAYFLVPESHAYIPSGEAILPILNRLAAGFRAHGRPVIFTHHLNTVENAGSMSRWWRDMITADHPLSQITPALDTGTDRVLGKSQYDAFFNTELDNILKDQHITQLLITGVMTHLCCETTARSAFVRGFEVFFPIDGTATYTEAFHLGSLQGLAHGFATLVLSRDILNSLNRDSG